MLSIGEPQFTYNFLGKFILDDGLSTLSATRSWAHAAARGASNPPKYICFLGPGIHMWASNLVHQKQHFTREGFNAADQTPNPNPQGPATLVAPQLIAHCPDASLPPPEFKPSMTPPSEQSRLGALPYSLSLSFPG